MTGARQERAQFWRVPELGNLELLRASYITHSFARHSHDGYGIGVIDQGGDRFDYRGAVHVAPAGSIVVIEPGEMHTGQAASAGGWAYRMLYPDAALLRKAACAVAGRERGLPSFREPVIYDALLASLIRDVHRALEDPASMLEREARLVEALAHLVARHADSGRTRAGVGRERAVVRRVREYLAAHYDRNVSLDELARLVNLSPFHLLRVFRTEVGLPPHSYLEGVRVAHAKALLSSGRSIAHVARETGFVDQSHFTRQFKRLVGITPGQYALGSKNIQDAGSPRY